MAEKIGQQARRTRELVSGLLSFAQQAPGQKNWVDLSTVVNRALRMEALRCESVRIRTECTIEPGLPKIWGDANQIFQCCSEIISNGIDALQDVGGGTLAVSSWWQDGQVALTFTDSGKGVEDPQRVFDPFYTTKPIGKGTGLGLSATYGIMQEHHGQVTCHNSDRGGAVFTLRFPVPEREPASAAVGA